MLKLFKIAAAILMAGVLLFGVCVFALYHLIRDGELKELLVRRFEEQTGATVRIGEMDFRFGHFMEAGFRDFVLSQPDREIPLMTADRITVRLALRPLLERRLVFHEVRFLSPLLRLEKDGAGNFPSLGLLSRLWSWPESGDNLKLDFKEVAIENGAVLVREAGPTGAVILEFRDTDLHLRRGSAPGRPSRPPAARLPEEKGLTLDFLLNTTIEQDGRAVTLGSKGQLHSSGGDFNFRQAELDADIDVETLPANVLADFLPPLKALEGTLAPSLHWQGSLSEGGRAKGKIEFKQLGFDAPEWFRQPVTPGDGQADFELEWNPRELRLSRWDFRSRDVSFSAGAVSVSRRSEGGAFLEGRFHTPFLPLKVAQSYLPRQLVESPQWRPWVQGWNEGEVRLADLRLRGFASDLQDLFSSGSNGGVEFDIELKNAASGAQGARHPALKEVNGRVALEKGVLYYRDLSGVYGQSRLTAIHGTQRGVFTNQPLLEVRLRGDIALKELTEILALPFFPANLSRHATLLADAAGTGQLELLLRTDFASLQHFEGQLSLDQAAFRMDDIFLTRVRGNVLFSTAGLYAERATALLSGSPVAVRLSLKDYLTDQGTFDLSVESPNARAGLVTRLLFSTGSPDDRGTVGGKVRYRGSLAAGGERTLTGLLDFRGAELSLLRDPLRDVAGQVSLREDGIDFRNLRGRLGEAAFHFDGEWRKGTAPDLAFNLRLAETDLGALLAQIGDGGAGWYDRLQAAGRVVIQKGRYEGFRFSDLETDVVLARRTWRIENFSARSAGGTIQGSGEFFDQDKRAHFSVRPKVDGVPIEELLKWFDLDSPEISGRVHLSGILESSGENGAERKRNLNGDLRLEISDGAIRRFRLLVLIMNFMDLARWFTLQMPDVFQEGIRFRTVTGDIAVSRGVYSTQNLLVDSDDLRITGAGKVDGPKGDIDAVVAVRPFPRLNAAVSFIPVIGPGIAAIKNSLLVASFRVTGSVENPVIVPAPLSTLSEFFFSALAIPRSLIGAPPEGKP